MKKYNKFYVKRDPATGGILKDGDKPKLGDIAKSDCPLEDRHVAILNKDWETTGIFYAEIEEESNQDELYKLTKAELVAKCEELGLDVEGNKPDLIERINNHKTD